MARILARITSAAFSSRPCRRRLPGAFPPPLLSEAACRRAPGVNGRRRASGVGRCRALAGVCRCIGVCVGGCPRASGVGRRALCRGRSPPLPPPPTAVPEAKAEGVVTMPTLTSSDTLAVTKSYRPPSPLRRTCPLGCNRSPSPLSASTHPPSTAKFAVAIQT